MRAFFLPPLTGLLLAVAASTAAAQYPGELTGHIADAITGEPVEGALVEVIGTSLSALSDGRGAFHIRGLEPGRLSVRFTRLGYESQVREIDLRNGETTWLAVELGARPIVIDGVSVEGRSDTTLDDAPGVIAIDRDEIERSGKSTAAGLLEGRAGLLVQRRGPLGPQTVSIRGSAADQVLVLLDGAPLGDPLTGSTDLSTIPTSQIESITVLKGSQSARFGPGAEAGAVLIQTRRESVPLTARLETGSLANRSATLETSGDLGLAWSLGGHLRSVDGEFDYRRPDGLGGGTDRRVNNDLSEAALFAAAAAPAAGGDLRLRAGFTRLERGLPGPSYQPTSTAREELSRWNGQAGWERRSGRSLVSAQLNGVLQSARFADPDPTVALPYDSRTDALALGARLNAETEPGGALRAISGGLELRGQKYESTALDDSAPGGRVDLGLFAATEVAGKDAPGSPRLVAALRLDRDGLDELWRLTHELTLSAATGPATFHVRHASSYSPPAFGDQFFREGVMVEPNPDLRAERIPSDLSVGAILRGRLGGIAGAIARLAIDGYIADVKDMIIWAPDFRFVWSPRNFDVKRRGLEAEAALEFPTPSFTVQATYSLARVTYDRPGDDTVQVIYRPRHSGTVGARWSPAGWEIAADARYIGKRYPVPAPINALDPYWTLDLRLRRSFNAGSWQFTPSLAIDRLFDNDDSLIFGYPEPGRIIRFELMARPLR